MMQIIIKKKLKCKMFIKPIELINITENKLMIYSVTENKLITQILPIYMGF